jgi:putative mycofactocin binding protein MftB
MACAASTSPDTAEFDLDRPWQVSRGVALRPERSGALAYSFDTRRLSFLKSRRLYDVVRTLAEHPSGRSACEAAGVQEVELTQVTAALRTLAGTGMIIERSTA